MNYYETYKNLPKEAQNCVIAIGNFDGVHLGHKALLDKARSIADELGCKVGVLTFEPHPRQLFRKDEAFRRITPHNLKIERLYESGADSIFSLPFDWEFASQPPEDFVRNILIEGLKACHIVIGYDFRFGQLRTGGAETVRAAGLPISVVDKVTIDEIGAISSSHIRQCLQEGLIQDANIALGWPWEVRGEIIHGDQRGRKLGYPTANMELGAAIHPAYGVYACRARLEGEDHWYEGVANIGIRPMFETKNALVETNIFDFDQEIYGKVLHVRPVKRLRGEAKFGSLEQLVQQMKKDCEQAKAVLKKD